MPDSVSERVSPPRLATEGQCAEDYCFMANCRGVAECWSQPNSKHSTKGSRYSHLPANDPPLQAPWLLPPSVRPMRTEDVSRRGERE